MGKALNQKGLTLIEVIVAIAILGIISISLLNIFSSSGVNIFGSGFESKEVQEARGEMERIAIDHTYRGQGGNKSLTAKYEKVKIFNEIDIEVVSLKSKIGNRETQLKAGDPHLFLLMTEKGSLSSSGKPFISKDGDYEFGPGDKIVPESELQEKEYKYNGEGILVIPIGSDFKKTDGINWSVKDGIAIIGDIYLTNGKDIKLRSESGDIVIEEKVALEGKVMSLTGKNVKIKPGANMDLNQLEITATAGDVFINGGVVEAQNGNIEIGSLGIIDITGSETTSTLLMVQGNSKIILKAGEKESPTTIRSNSYTRFENKKGETLTAINEYGATIEGGKE